MASREKWPHDHEQKHKAAAAKGWAKRRQSPKRKAIERAIVGELLTLGELPPTAARLRRMRTLERHLEAGTTPPASKQLKQFTYGHTPKRRGGAK